MAISETELRAHFSRSAAALSRKPLDAFGLAVHLAKARAATLRALETGVETHWTVWDAPVYRGQQQAGCGSYVDVKHMSGTPSCPACRQALARYEALEF